MSKLTRNPIELDFLEKTWLHTEVLTGLLDWSIMPVLIVVRQWSLLEMKRAG
jgi:hypothetical protein